jgi:starch phosphorylase
MTVPGYYLLPPLPKSLEGLTELALDMRWSWNHNADRLWERIDPELWRTTGNPWYILQTVSPSQLKALEADNDFRQLLRESIELYHKYREGPSWFEQVHGNSAFTVAYFSMEFGLGEALPIYSGGLGILAGDYLKTASDLGLFVIGIGLLYQEGYFRQVLDGKGRQRELFPFNDPGQMPVLPVRDRTGEWLRIEVDLPGRKLVLRVWEANVGQSKLYLLDSNDLINSPADRGITSELYGGEEELRLQQEIVLGIGGWRILNSLGLKPDICHLNEGHAALAVIERARTFMIENNQPFDISLTATRPGNIFTTHTPVAAGFDRFSHELVKTYLGAYTEKLGIDFEDFMAMGRQNFLNIEEPLNMAYLAIRGSGTINGVSRLHGEVSRRIFQPLFPRIPAHEIPVTYVTNGVHVPSWDSAVADTLWSNSCGKERWLGTMNTIEQDLKKIPDETIWAFRNSRVSQLIQYAREQIVWQLESEGASAKEITENKLLLDPDILTIGFARRFTDYKRPNLLLHDPDRLIKILNNPTKPVQIIIAGKAHPRDLDGKRMVQAWTEFIAGPEVRPRAVFFMDYDMSIAQELVQGIDLWINTPRRPWEACGTSGMKVLVNGGLNLSERDGWWAEAYRPDLGWALGDGREHGNDASWDAEEAGELYRLLEEDIVPCFYKRDDKGIPRAWVSRMKMSMAELTPRFSTNRMLREYVERLYLPGVDAYRKRTAKKCRQAITIRDWQDSLDSHWRKIHFGQLAVLSENNKLSFKVPVYLAECEPNMIKVQLYADPEEGNEGPEIHQMKRGKALIDTANGYEYEAVITSERPAGDYTPRIIPSLKEALVPLEATQILWYE